LRSKGIAEVAKTIAGLLPLAVALVGVGVAIWWLLSRQMAAGTWLLAAVVVGHGLIHVLFVTPAPASAAQPGAAEWPFDMSRSLLATRAGTDLNLVRLVGTALVCVVALGFVLTGLSTAGILIPSGWWQGLVVVSAAASVVLVLFFNFQLVLGLGLDVVLLWVAFAAIWTPAAAA
jgi:hypothetical protein